MTQIRQQIRNRVETLLRDKTKAKERVNINPFAFGDPYPYIEVTTPLELRELGGQSPRITANTLTLFIDVYGSCVDESIWDQLDEISCEIEKLIDKDETLGGLVSSAILSKAEMDKKEEGRTTIGMLRLTYECEFHLQKNPMDTGLKPFKQWILQDNLS